MRSYTTRWGFQRLWKSTTLASVLQFLMVITVLHSQCSLVQATLSGEMAGVDGDNIANEMADSATEEKRSWQSLQGAWGKRWSAGEPSELEDELYLADHWPLPVLVTNAATLERLANQRQIADAATFRLGDELLADLEDMESGNGIANEKRTWKNLNAAWGKRRQAPTWNKFSGAWGKREPGWNNLKGMWGKRASKDWQKLHAGWGKRAQSLPVAN